VKILDEMVGKSFKYDSPHGGPSEWTDIVKGVFETYEVFMGNPGYKIKLHVIGSDGVTPYELDRVILLDKVVRS
jgi:hypothetical protein